MFRKAFLLVACLLLLKASALEKIPMDDVTAMGYQSIAGGEIHKADLAAGGYAMYRNPENNMMMILLVYRPEAGSPLATLEPEALTTHLLGSYVGLTEHVAYVLEESPVKTTAGYAAVTHMRVRFSDAFVEPDIIARFDYDEGHQAVLLLGMPVDGDREQCSAFKKNFSVMEAALVDLVDNTALKSGIIASQKAGVTRILWNSVRHLGYQPDCWEAP